MRMIPCPKCNQNGQTSEPCCCENIDHCQPEERCSKCNKACLIHPNQSANALDKRLHGGNDE